MSVLAPDVIDKIDLKSSTVMLRKDGIMHLYIKSDEEFKVKDVMEMVEATGLIGGGKKFPNLITPDQYTIAEKEVRDYSASPEANRYTLADAFVTDSLPQKILINFYIRFNKPVVPTRFFSSKEKAIEWLRTFL